MYTGTNRSDFILRMIQAREMEDINPEVMDLLEDLFAAFERGFNVAISLKNDGGGKFEDIGEMLRLSLMNDNKGLKELSKQMQKDLEEIRKKNRELDELQEQVNTLKEKNKIKETEIMAREVRLEQLKKKGLFSRFLDWI